MAAAPMRTIALRGTCRSAYVTATATATASSPRRLAVFSPAKAQVQLATQPAEDQSHPPPASPGSFTGDSLAKRKQLSKTYFDVSGLLWTGAGGEQPPDPNKAKLGKTLRILQERLPTLLQKPLPQDILAPNITLHLFPSTHPHLPIVSGRVAYNAALWTSPIAWNRVPIIGNVRIEVLAERMTTEPLTFLPRRSGVIPEQLVVRWCERRRPTSNNGKSTDDEGIGASLLFRRGADPKKAFTGLFIFDFDREGRILSHTIEQSQAGNNWEAGVGAKVVGLTDWLLGGMKDQNDTPIPMYERLRKRHDR